MISINTRNFKEDVKFVKRETHEGMMAVSHSFLFRLADDGISLRLRHLMTKYMGACRFSFHQTSRRGRHPARDDSECISEEIRASLDVIDFLSSSCHFQ